MGGSRESNKVYISFAKLFKIVRVSNTAFFSGNLEWAYHFVSDALKLFRKIEDRKAIGVASNNVRAAAPYSTAVSAFSYDTLFPF